MKKSILRLLLVAIVSIGITLPVWQIASAGTGDDEDTGKLLEADSPLGGMLDLLNCDDGGIATWKKSMLTFKIDNAAGDDAKAIDAVRAGVLVWNKANGPYTLSEVVSGKADITITTVEELRTPTTIGNADGVCKKGVNGFSTMSISLKLDKLPLIGVKNLAAHETGHALGLGHSDRTGDLMSPSYEKFIDGLLSVCPSNLDVQGLTSKQDPTKILPVLWLMLPIC